MHNDTLRALYLCILSSGETTETDKPKESQPLLEQEHQNGQRLLEKKAFTSLPSAILLDIRPKLTFPETTGQRPNI